MSKAEQDSTFAVYVNDEWAVQSLLENKKIAEIHQQSLSGGHFFRVTGALSEQEAEEERRRIADLVMGALPIPKVCVEPFPQMPIRERRRDVWPALGTELAGSTSM